MKFPKEREKIPKKKDPKEKKEKKKREKKKIHFITLSIERCK